MASGFCPASDERNDADLAGEYLSCSIAAAGRRRRKRARAFSSVPSRAFCELCGGGRLARALQAGQQHDRGRRHREIERSDLPPMRRRQLAVAPPRPPASCPGARLPITCSPRRRRALGAMNRARRERPRPLRGAPRGPRGSASWMFASVRRASRASSWRSGQALVRLSSTGWGS